MSQIDRLLAVMVSRGAGTLLLDEGSPASVDTASEDRIVSRGALTGQQIVSLVREIAPAGSVEAIEGGRPAEFTFVSESGSYRARAAREDSRWRVSVAAIDSTPTGQPPSQGAGDPPSPRMGEPAIPRAGDPPSAAGSAGDSADKAPAREIQIADPAAAEMDALLIEAITKKASDLHLRCGEPPILRCDGEIVRLEGWPAMSEARVTWLLRATMPRYNWDQMVESQDTDFAYEIPGRGRFRVNVLNDRKGLGAVFRHIPPVVATVEDLGLSNELQRLTQLTRGLVVVTGPTGSGKSTTLSALVDLANRTRKDHIITIEDPIEFVHESKRCIITQRQVGQHTQSFKAALRAALREDPDIVLIGEMRDLETIAIALETAETGHLVFATLHTTTAAGTVDRIIDQFPADQQDQIRVMLADSLRAVLAQTLCKRIGGGRVAAREVLFNTPSVANLIRERKTFQIPSIMQTSKRFGMLTLNDALVELTESGQVSADEAYTHAVDKPAFVGALKARGVDVGFAEPDALNARMSGSYRPVAS